jgi:predicted phosphoribosyltransferase
MIYRDRADAGRHLARLLREQLPGLAAEGPMVVATFPSGVIVGRAIADALDAPLDVLVARRLDAPGYGDVGIGAVASGGTRVLDTLTIRMLGVSDAYIDEVTRAEAAEVERATARVRQGRGMLDVRGRTVVLADDGSATRWRAGAAVRALRELEARRIILAVPATSSDVRDLLARECDAVVCGCVPERWCGAAACFDDFSLPREEAVLRALARVGPRRPAAPADVARPAAAPQSAPALPV